MTAEQMYSMYNDMRCIMLGSTPFPWGGHSQGYKALWADLFCEVQKRLPAHVSGEDLFVFYGILYRMHVYWNAATDPWDPWKAQSTKTMIFWNTFSDALRIALAGGTSEEQDYISDHEYYIHTGLRR